jgi:hypothetical protein
MRIQLSNNTIIVIVEERLVGTIFSNKIVLHGISHEFIKGGTQTPYILDHFEFNREDTGMLLSE